MLVGQGSPVMTLLRGTTVSLPQQAGIRQVTLRLGPIVNSPIGASLSASARCSLTHKP
jgi:hypothetical protein